MSAWLANTLTFVRTNNTVDIGVRDVLGNNLPHTLIVRNRNEMVDQALGQFGNSLLFYGGGWLFDKAVDVAARPWQKHLSTAQRTWLHTGKSLGLYAFLSTLMIASAQWRNAITTKRTGTTNYTDMIGETQHNTETPEAVTQQVRQYVNKGLAIVRLNLPILAGLIPVTALLIARKARVPKAVQWLNQHVLLREGKFSKMPDVGDIICGAGAAYLGWFLASRDGFEMKELILRFSAFVLSFFVLPHMVAKQVGKRLPASVSKIFGSIENAAYLSKLGASILFCTAIPSLLNIYLTHQRVLKAEKDAPAMPKTPLMHQDFNAFYHHVATLAQRRHTHTTFTVQAQAPQQLMATA